MLDLLKTEWLKIRRYRAFWWMAGAFLVLTPWFNYSVYDGLISPGVEGGINILNTAYSFPGVWANVGFWGSVFVWFLCVLVIMLTCSEYTYRTHRQAVIDGWSRTDFLHAKVAGILVLALLASLYTMMVGLLFGGLTSGGFGRATDGLEGMLWFFLLCTNYLAFSLLLALWIRRSGLAIGAFLGYVLILEFILHGTLGKLFGRHAGDFLPLQSSDELLPFPLARVLGGLLGSTALNPWMYAGATVLWIGLYYLAGRRMLQRRDW